jgi:hypothetical protein
VLIVDRSMYMQTLSVQWQLRAAAVVHLFGLVRAAVCRKLTSASDWLSTVPHTLTVAY